MLPSIIVCCYNVIFYVMDNQLQPTSSHQLKYKRKSYHKKTRTNHHKGIKKKSSLSTITIRPWTLLITTRDFKKSQLLHLNQFPWNIPEFWAEIFIFISTQSLPTSSKILKTKLFQWISNTIYSI